VGHLLGAQRPVLIVGGGANHSQAGQEVIAVAEWLAAPAEFEEGLDEAFASDGPVFLDVITESEVTELPPVYSWLKAAEKHKKPLVHSR
jgi:thiamine pyrophosphate-dependent acetolactate synthase large subunit-like protein